MNDRYTKIILTIIALCLIWLCVKDFAVGSSSLLASEQQSVGMSVKILDVNFDAFEGTLPIAVKVTELPKPQEGRTR